MTIDKEYTTITGLLAPIKRSYNGTFILNSDFGIPTFKPEWNGTLEYTYYKVKDGEKTELAAEPKYAGNYIVLISIPESDPSYVGSVELAFSIDKATVMVKANDKYMKRNANTPSYDVTYSGFGMGDTENTVIDNKAVAVCAADGKTTGKFPIIFSKEATLKSEANENYTLSHTTGTLTVENSSSPSDSNSSGNSSSTIESPIVLPPSKGKINYGKSNVSVTVDKDGNANITLTEKNISDAIKAAQEIAKKENSTNKEIAIEIIVGMNKNISQLKATLPKSVQETIIQNHVQSVKITSNNGSINFSNKAIQKMNQQAKDDIYITSAKTELKNLKGNAKTIIGNRPIFRYQVTYGDGKTITKFGKNSVYIEIPYKLGKKESAANIQAIYIGDKNNVVKIANSSYDVSKESLLFMTDHFSSYAVGYIPTAAKYSDIAKHPAKQGIEFVTSRGYIDSTSKTTFSPNSAMTRAAIAVALGRLSGEDMSSYKKSSFQDIKENDASMPYIEWANEKGVLKGINPTDFAPNQPVTREEMAVILCNYAKATGFSIPELQKQSSFADRLLITPSAFDAVDTLKKAGILVGKADNKFDPKGTLTRAAASTILNRYVKLLVS